MRTLSTALLVEMGVTFTRPGYFIEVDYSTTLRLSTLGDLAWNSQSWSAFDARVSGLSQDGKGSNTGILALGNTNGAIGALSLTEGVLDIPVVIWAVYPGATATGDVVEVFRGVTDGAGYEPGKVTFQLSNPKLQSPRVVISQLTGFSYSKPAGSVVPWGSEVYALPPLFTI